MPIAINGSGTVTGISVGGLPDGIVDADMLASNAVTAAKIASNIIDTGKLASTVNVAKMWVNFDGTGTVAIRDSFNVSSVSDNGTGDYAVNIDTDMSNSNYCVVTAGNTGGGAGSKSVYVNSTDTDHTDIMSYDNGGNQQDRARICVAAFGDT